MKEKRQLTCMWVDQKRVIYKYFKPVHLIVVTAGALQETGLNLNNCHIIPNKCLFPSHNCDIICKKVPYIGKQEQGHSKVTNTPNAILCLKSNGQSHNDL